MYSIILVDDHPAIRFAIRGLLQQMQRFTDIRDADNATQALALMQQAPADLLLIDLGLPQIGGLELITTLHSNHPQARLLVLSAQDEAIFAPRAQQAGADGFVSKTSDSQVITKAIEAILAGYTYFPRRSAYPGRDNKNAAHDKVASLSNRELAVLQGFANGLTNQQIAENLGISSKTVGTYKVNIKTKLEATTPLQVIDFARTHHLVRERKPGKTENTLQ